MSYANTALLLPLNGADAGTSFPDFSRHNRTVTAVGNAQTSTAQSQFYGSSALFDGANDYLFLPADDANWRFNTAGFCVELWVRLAANNETEYLVAHKSGNDNGWAFYTFNTGVISFLVWNTATGTYLQAAGSHGMSAGVWYHLAADWDATTLRLFVAGTSIGSSTTITGTIDHAAAGSALLIGRDVSTIPDRDYTGHMQDVRITRNSRYTANFTPPGKLTGVLSNTGTGGEPVKDDTGTAASRTIIAMPRSYSVAPPRSFLTTSDGSGNFSLEVPSSAEFSDIDDYAVIALDDAAGTDYNDKIYGRVPTV